MTPEQRRAVVNAVACTYCGAVPRLSCTARGRRFVSPHMVRLVAAVEVGALADAVVEAERERRR